MRLSRPGAAALLFAALLCLFTTRVYLRGATLDPNARDQSTDLTLALHGHEGKALTNGNRNPLLPLLLSPFASREPSFFSDARLVAVGLAALCLLVFYAATARVYGALLALLASLLFCTELQHQADRICPELLLPIFLLPATALLAGLERSRRPRLRLLAAGMLVGAAWLSKGTALLALAGFCVWLLARARRRILRPALLLFGFALTAAPLLYYNQVHHGWPLFNVNTAHVIWEDRWDQDLDRTSTASPKTYFEKHTPGEAITRLGHGLLHQKGVEYPYAFLALAGLLALFRRRRGEENDPSPARRDWRSLAAVQCLFWVPPFAFYAPIVSSRRFLFPLIAILIPPLLDTLFRFAPRSWRRRLPAALPVRAAAVLASLAGAASLLLAALHGSPFKEHHFDRATLALVRRLRSPHFRGAHILAKPSRTIPPDWMLDGFVTLDAIPDAVPDRDAKRWIQHREDYVLLNVGLRALRPGLFAPMADLDPERGLVARALPAWLSRAAERSPPPARYLLLAVSGRGG